MTIDDFNYKKFHSQNQNPSEISFNGKFCFHALPMCYQKNSKQAPHVRAYDQNFERTWVFALWSQQAALEKLFDEILNATSKAAFRRNAKLNFVAKQLIIRNL